MKKQIFILLIVCIFTLHTVKTFAQCSHKLEMYQRYCPECVNGNEILLNWYKAKLKNRKNNVPLQKVIFSEILNKGNHYRFIVVDPPGFEGRTMLQLINNNNKLIASTYNDTTRKNYTCFDFFCNMTNKYYITISYKPERREKKGCAMGVLLLVRD